MFIYQGFWAQEIQRKNVLLRLAINFLHSNETPQESQLNRVRIGQLEKKQVGCQYSL